MHGSLEPSLSFLPGKACAGDGKSRRHQNEGSPKVCLKVTSATDLAVDISENFHISESAPMPTPRRSLFGPLAGKSQSSSMASCFLSLQSSSWSGPADVSPIQATRKQQPQSLTVSLSTYCETEEWSGEGGALECTPTAPGRGLPQRLPISESTPTVVRDITPHRLEFDNPRLFGPPLPRKLGVGRKPYGKSISVATLGPPATLSGDRTGDMDVSAVTNERPSFALSPSLSGLPPNKVRRTQSMFQSAQEFLTQQMSPVMVAPSMHVPELDDISQSLLSRPGCQIKTFTKKQDFFRRIKRETLVGLLDGQIPNMFGAIVIVDCRFEYEYEGGHIAGAININNKAALEQALVQNVEQIKKKEGENVLLVFHCEYSAYRGPLMATHLRHCDRRANASRYPHLHYPDIVILDGGYSDFYEHHNTRCEPQNYVGMNDKLYKHACEREMEKFRSNMQLKKSSTFTEACGIVEGSPGRTFRFPLREVGLNVPGPTPQKRHARRLRA